VEPKLNGSMTGVLLRKLDGDWSVKPFKLQRFRV
jgi:hypothetical protein